MKDNGNNGHDWAAIRKAFEAGEPWSKLTQMAPKSSIWRMVKRDGWDASGRNGHLKVVRNTPEQGPKEQEETVPPKKKLRHYSNAQKAEALLTYIELGSALLTSKETGIPSGTIRKWVCKDPSWRNAKEQASQAIRDILDTESRAIIERHVGLLLTDIDAQRLNAANSIIKNITQTVALLAGDPTERSEHIVTRDEARQTLQRELGLGHLGAEEDASTVSTEVPSGSLPS